MSDRAVTYYSRRRTPPKVAIEAVSGAVILDQPRPVDQGYSSGVKRLAGAAAQARVRLVGR
ncbi:MAG: hypothetical protein OXH96_22600 [Spirochaetaceae bacterium]|nr:hypothetical protein [Spirochaetaceae bacterium]